MQDKEVWQEGRKIGLSRGLAIGTVDYFMNGLAGFTYRSTASGLRKAGGILLEGAVVQPLGEGFGELAAQGAGFAVAGKEINLNEITMEALGGLGSKTPQLAGKVFYNSTNAYKKSLADKLATNLNFVVDQNQSPQRINTWAQQMLDQKLIDQDTYNKIKDNATVVDEANQAFDNMRGDMSLPARALNTIKNGRKNKQIKSRLSSLIEEQRELQKAKEKIKKSGGDASVLNNALKQISQELNTIQYDPQSVVDNSYTII